VSHTYSHSDCVIHSSCSMCKPAPFLVQLLTHPNHSSAVMAFLAYQLHLVDVVDDAMASNPSSLPPVLALMTSMAGVHESPGHLFVHVILVRSIRFSRFCVTIFCFSMMPHKVGVRVYVVPIFYVFLVSKYRACFVEIHLRKKWIWILDSPWISSTVDLRSTVDLPENCLATKQLQIHETMVLVGVSYFYLGL